MRDIERHVKQRLRQVLEYVQFADKTEGTPDFFQHVDVDATNLRDLVPHKTATGQAGRQQRLPSDAGASSGVRTDPRGAVRGLATRITVRLSTEDHMKLQRRSEVTGLDFSLLVRQALGMYLADNGSRGKEPVSENTGFVLPAEIFSLTPPFRGLGRDLRSELRKDLLRFTALAHVALEHWPRTAWIRGLCAALLELHRHLVSGEDGGRD